MILCCVVIVMYSAHKGRNVFLIKEGKDEAFLENK